MTETALPVRPASPRDASLLATLHAPCFVDEPWSAEALAVLLESPGVFGLIAFAGAVAPDQALTTALAAPAVSACGFILCRIAADEAEVLTLAVPPADRRQGTGRRLLAGALAWAAHHAVGTLLLEVAEDNDAARALYADAGFRQVGCRPGYYRRISQSPISALVLARPLSQAEFLLSPLQP